MRYHLGLTQFYFMPLDLHIDLNLWLLKVKDVNGQLVLPPENVKSLYIDSVIIVKGSVCSVGVCQGLGGCLCEDLATC